MTDKKKPKPFKLPSFKTRKAKHNGMLSALVTTQSSQERVQENTPVLKALYEFLARPVP